MAWALIFTPSGRLHRAKEHSHRGAGPCYDDGHADPRGLEASGGVSSVKDARAPFSPISIIRDTIVVLRGEEARRNHSPEAASAVDRDGVDRVVEAGGLHAERRRDIDAAACVKISFTAPSRGVVCE